jgi:chromosome segregation ATPase
VARLTRDVGAALPVDAIDHALDEQLYVVEREIRRLEADRSEARQRIEELETANERAQSLINAQRRRLLVLERQLEDAQVVPATDSLSRTSWLDRLLGGSGGALVRT